MIKIVVRDHLKKKRPDYSFEDWEVIFYLMGALESRPSVETKSTTEDDRCSLDWKDEKGMMDWLHGRNPLNATETLTEWLLLTLVEKLELELLELRRKMGSVSVN